MPNKISSLLHPIVKHFVKLRDSALYRHEQDSVLLMGNRLVAEVMQKRAPKEVFTKERVTENILRKVSGLSTFNETIAEFPMPKQQSLDSFSKLLVIDHIADPGNLGTLLRTAVALGWEGVFILPNSVDPFNDKVMRSSRAALFSLPYKMGSFEDLNSLSIGFTPLIADLSGQNLQQIAKPQKPMLVLSNEAHGVSEKMKKWGTRITIPIANMESLNVAAAGAILMYYL